MVHSSASTACYSKVALTRCWLATGILLALWHGAADAQSPPTCESSALVQYQIKNLAASDEKVRVFRYPDSHRKLAVHAARPNRGNTAAEEDASEHVAGVRAAAGGLSYRNCKDDISEQRSIDRTFPTMR